MAAEAEAEEEVRIPGARSQMAVHEAQVTYLEETYGVDLSTYSAAEIIAIAYATRVEWRQTEIYHEVKNGLGETREAEKEAKRLEREEAAAVKAAEREAKAAEKAAKADGAEKPAGKTSKATAKKAAPAKKAAAKKGAKDPFK